MAEEAKPPYVVFETRDIEDREASIAAGHYVGKDIVFAIVTPAGTRDRIEKVAEEWLAGVEEGVKQERIPASWLSAYKRALDDFRNSRETPEFGTPVKDWPGASSGQIKLLLDINVRTVEELASANEEVVQRIGMGGRALKQKAQAWLDSSNDVGKVASEIEKLRQRNEELEQRDIERNEQLEKMQRQIDALVPATEEA